MSHRNVTTWPSSASNHILAVFLHLWYAHRSTAVGLQTNDESIHFSGQAHTKVWSTMLHTLHNAYNWFKKQNVGNFTDCKKNNLFILPGLVVWWHTASQTRAFASVRWYKLWPDLHHKWQTILKIKLKKKYWHKLKTARPLYHIVIN